MLKFLKLHMYINPLLLPLQLCIQEVLNRVPYVVTKEWLAHWLFTVEHSGVEMLQLAFHFRIDTKYRGLTFTWPFTSYLIFTGI